MPSAQTTSVIRTTPPAAPSFAGAPVEPPPFGEQPPIGQPAAQDPRRQLIIRFGAVCAALLAVLVVVLIYALFIHRDNTLQVSAGPSSTTKSAAPTTTSGNGPGGTGTETATESPTTASGSGPQGTDAGLTFAVTGVETAPSVQSQDAPVEQTAQGEYLIVHLTVLNSGDQPGTFVGTFQKLKAGGTTYSIDDVATAYLNGTVAQLNPGDTSDLAIAFDVPPGTAPESLEAHGDPSAPASTFPCRSLTHTGSVADTLYADVSEWQVGVNDSYPYPVLCIRSNDGTYRDRRWVNNYGWCLRNADSGRLTFFIVYFVWRLNWQQTVDTFKDMVRTPHPKMAVMLDVESWGGQLSGDQSAGINAAYEAVGAFIGSTAKVIGYGNVSDLNTLWPNKPPGIRLVTAAYGNNPPYPARSPTIHDGSATAAVCLKARRHSAVAI